MFIPLATARGSVTLSFIFGVYMSTESLPQHYLADAIQTFRDYKILAERAFAQISDEDFFKTLDDESNSIAVNMKHMAGNMLSRWTDFLTFRR